ncbi:SDR family oxidoreductase [Stutzerimonas urumqiensis]|uniref:SDR family oxidoreductase n=1 Tax=Stutzerimonas urumqiensis TaxID=638269 RepID=UPI003DA432ED
MDSNDPDLARRKLMQGAAVTLAAAGLSGTAFAQGADAPAAGANPGPGTPKTPGLHDPRKLYVQPPFEKQSQPWPGLAQKMDPRPDHGELSYQGSGRLTGRKALITGGDSGIGRAAAIAYAREGADVAIGYLPNEEPDAQDVARLITEAGRKAVLLPGDIRDEAFCREMVQQAVDQLGGLDILVINAARQQSHPSIMDITTEQFDWTLKTNLYAMFWLTKAALPHLPAGASIINTASVVAYDPPKNLLDYSLTKAGIVNFSKCLAKQVIEQGVRVNAVAPGPFWTPLQVSGGQTMENLQSFGKQTPAGRPGQPVELAKVYVLLASDDASYITGQVYGASGGMGEP